MVPGQKIADTQQYEVIEDLALAANRWSKMKPNISVETGRSLMRKLGSRNNEIANALISGLSKSTLKFYDRFISPIPSRPRPIVTTKTIAASTHGGRAGQSSVPRKIMPRAPTSMPTQKSPISIVPVPHKQTKEPPGLFWSNSDTPDADRQFDSPRRSPRNMSSRAVRVSSAPLQLSTA